MRRRRVRRLPVVDGNGSIVGILSLHDIALAAPWGAVPPAEVASTLAAICAPRAAASA